MAKALVIRYEKLFNLGNYRNEKVGIEVAVEDGENAMDVLNKAKAFVDTHNPEKQVDGYELDKAKRIVADPDSFTGHQVKKAKETINRFERMQSNDFGF